MQLNFLFNAASSGHSPSWGMGKIQGGESNIVPLNDYVSHNVSMSLFQSCVHFLGRLAYRFGCPHVPIEAPVAALSGPSRSCALRRGRIGIFSFVSSGCLFLSTRSGTSSTGGIGEVQLRAMCPLTLQLLQVFFSLSAYRGVVL